MKKLMLIGIISVFSFHSFAQFSLTCPEIYERVMISKQIQKKKASDLADDLSLGGLLIGLTAPAVGLGILATSAGAFIYGESMSKEERVLALKEEGSRQLEKLTKKLRKKISSEITSDEILEIIQGGLVDGLYCRDFPKLASKRVVEDHVSETLKLKYPVRK
jgi:hypothetical protein